MEPPEPLEQFYVCLKAPARIGSVQTSSGDSPPKVRFAVDSPLEGDGFEPSVPRKKDNVFRACARSTSPSDAARGTEGSNPSPSSGESNANRPKSAGSYLAEANAIRKALRPDLLSQIGGLRPVAVDLGSAPRPPFAILVVSSY